MLFFNNVNSRLQNRLLLIKKSITLFSIAAIYSACTQPAGNAGSQKAVFYNGKNWPSWTTAQPVVLDISEESAIKFSQDELAPQFPGGIVVLGTDSPSAIAAVNEYGNCSFHNAGRVWLEEKQSEVLLVREGKGISAGTAAEKESGRKSNLLVLYESEPAALYEAVDENGMHFYTTRRDQVNDQASILCYVPKTDRADSILTKTGAAAVKEYFTDQDPWLVVEGRSGIEKLCASAAKTEVPLYCFENRQTKDTVLRPSPGLSADLQESEALYWQGSEDWMMPEAPEGYELSGLAGYCLYLSPVIYDDLAGTIGGPVQ